MESKLLKEEPINYNGELYYIHLTHYYDGKPAIILDRQNELQYNQESIVVTTNLEETDTDEVAILDDDDFHLLEREGIVKYNGFLSSGFNTYYWCRLLIENEVEDTDSDEYDEIYATELKSMEEW